MKNKFAGLISLSLLTGLVFNPYGTNLFELSKLHFLSIFISAATLILLICFLWKGELKFRFNKIFFILLGLWILSLVISTIFSIAPDLSLWGSYNRVQGLHSQIIYIISLLFFLNILVKESEQKVFLKTLVIISLIIAVLSIFQKIGLSSLSSKIDLNEYLGRSYSTLGHPVSLGQFLIFPIWATGFFLIKNKHKFLLILSLIILLTALLFTENRASMLGILSAIILMLLFIPKYKKVYKVLFTGTLILGFSSFLIFFAPTIRSLLARFYIWSGSLKAFLLNPFQGSGLETFEIIFQKVMPTDLFKYEKLYSIADRAHNEYLDILVMQGAIGFIIFLTILISILYLIFKNKKKLIKNKILLVSGFAFLSIIISNFFSFSLTSHYLIFMALIAIILNSLIKFKTIKIQKKPLTIFLAGLFIAMALLNIFHSTKVIYADTLFAQGYQTNRVDLMNRAVNINKNQGELYYYFSEYLKDIFEYDYAERQLESAGKFFNKDFKYYYYKGDFQKAHELAPHNPVIIKALGKSYFEEGEYKKCIEIYEEFLAMVPDYWKWKNNQNSLSVEEKEDYRLFFKHAPDFWEIFGYLEKCYRQTGDDKKGDYYSKFSTE